MIVGFYNQYYFLSNYYPCKIQLNNATYNSVSQAFIIAEKVIGKNKWNILKLPTMKDLVFQKFKMHFHLQQLLLTTGNKELINSNTTGDIFWGVCDGIGKNHLGRILMQIRNHLYHKVFLNY